MKKERGTLGVRSASPVLTREEKKCTDRILRIRRLYSQYCARKTSKSCCAHLRVARQVPGGILFYYFFFTRVPTHVDTHHTSSRLASMLLRAGQIEELLESCVYTGVTHACRSGQARIAHLSATR